MKSIIAWPWIINSLVNYKWNQWAARGVATGEADLSEDAIQLRQLFRELSPENQKVAVELLRVLNRPHKSK